MKDLSKLSYLQLNEEFNKCTNNKKRRRIIDAMKRIEQEVLSIREKELQPVFKSLFSFMDNSTLVFILFTCSIIATFLILKYK